MGTVAQATSRWKSPSGVVASVGARTRIESIDIVRGVIMIVMALDHTRDFFGIAGQNPTDLTTASAALFFTRWVTNICAPVFFLLTGTGAYLSLRRRSVAGLSRFLVTRGLWLIFIETVVLRCLGYQFNFDFHVTMLVVLWALGWAMITLAVLVRLPTIAIATVGVVMIATHNLFHSTGAVGVLTAILHSPGFVLNTPTHVVFVAYPLIPWIGVTAVGYALGQLYRWDADRRRAMMLRLGLGVTAAFLALRAVNRYGDPGHWAPQKSALFTVLSFLNTVKYPPSLLFLLMTLGPALLFLWSVDRTTPTVLRPALVFGKVPFFFYVLHFPLIHLLALATCYLRYGSGHWMFESPDLAHYPFSPPPGWGFSLPVVYLIWAFVVCAMYPVCRWYAGLKTRRSDWWLSYL